MSRTSRFANALLATIVSTMMMSTMAASPVQAQDLAPPPLSAEKKKYYDAHPEEFQQLLKSVPPVSHTVVPGTQLAPGQAPTAGTWTSIAHPNGQNLSNPQLLTDGRVVAHVSCTGSWYALTPDSSGSYINGTWAAIASLPSGYTPRFFGSGVLPDGRFIIEGGEYNAGCAAADTNLGAIYDPVANSWTAVSPPSGWAKIGDAAGIVLPNGTYMQTDCCETSPFRAALLNPTTLTWTATGTGKFDVYDEESMALLPDGTVLTADAYVFTGTCGTGSERYDPTTGAWSNAGSTVAQQSDCNNKQSFEVGPLVMRPDGTAVHFSGVTTGTPRTAIYTVGSHSWAAGPLHPSVSGVPYTMADAPAAVLPNGNILVAMSPSNWAASNSFPTPVHYFELDITNNTFTQVPDKSDAASFNSYQHNFIVLPTGQIMDFTIDGPTIQVYTPVGTYQAAWQPTVTSVPSSVAPGQTYSVSGTQFNGLSEGAYYGDDTQASTNFPLVRIVNNGTGHVFYARTTAHSNRSIASGNATTTNFTVPNGIETGASTLSVVANGIPSAGQAITVGSSGAAAVLTTPPPGTTLAGSTVTFQWTAGTGVTQYYLYVGTTGVDSADLFAQSTGTTRQATLTNLPTTGGTVYVRLWSLIGGTWSFNDYTYTAFSGAKAVLTTPQPGSTIQTTSVNFGWTAGTGVTQYWLYVGTSGAGSSDIFSQSAGTSTSKTVTGIPLNGQTVYVRLWSLIGGTWQFNDYTYFTVGTQAAMISPVQGSTFSGTTVNFQWTTGTGVTQYWLYVGTSGAGSNNLFSQSTGTTQSANVSGLPLTGVTVYVRLWSLIGATWYFNDYTYKAATGQAATMISPSPNTTLAGTTVAFSWTTGVGATQYYLYVGTGGVGSNNLFSQSTGTTTNQTVNGLPNNGSTVYVRLWSLVAGNWLFNDYLYKATGAAACAVVSTPVPGSTLSSSTVAFSWSAASGATQYWLYVGTSVGGNNIYNQSTGATTSATVSGIPANGNPIYVRLWSLISGTWCFSDQSYGTSNGIAAAITSPTPGSTLSATTVTFQWSAGTGATQYWLYVGTTGAGSANIFSHSESLGTLTQSVSGLPSDGSTVYVRLWTLLSGNWVFNDYIYQATGTGALADMISPAPNSALTSSTVTFQWTLGINVSQYYLYVGTSIGNNDIYSQGTGTSRQATVSGIPLNGRTIYVRLWSLIGSIWGYHDYAYSSGVLFTDQISLWQSAAAGFSNVASGYGATSTALGSGAVNYPSANIVGANGGGWATWCCGYTGNVVWVPSASSVTITLSGVAAFGFEVEPDLFAVEGTTVTLSNGETLTDNVNGYYGAQFFGFVGRGITSITITNNSGDDFAFGNFRYLPDTGAVASVVVASADKNLNFSAKPSSVPATVKCSSEACNTRATGNGNSNK